MVRVGTLTFLTTFVIPANAGIPRRIEPEECLRGKTSIAQGFRLSPE
jgi:hypothetical protein